MTFGNFKDLDRTAADKVLHDQAEKESTVTCYRQYLGADLADMQSIRKFNKGFRFSLCVVDN